MVLHRRDRLSGNRYYCRHGANQGRENQVYKAILSGALDPEDCRLLNRFSKVTIIHSSSGSIFIYNHVVELVLSTKPDDTRPLTTSVYEVSYDITDGGFDNHRIERHEEVMSKITEWARKVKEIIDTPDLWTEMRGRKEFIEDVQQSSDNVPFAQDEQGQIAAQLLGNKNEMRTQFELSSEQAADVDEKIDELVEAAVRMGRKDWLIYSLGTITALIITATVAAPVGEHILAMIVHGLAHLFTGGNEPPEIPPHVLA
jgi:hypothetical protein